MKQAKKGQTIVYMGNNWQRFYLLWHDYGRILLPTDLSAIVIDEFIKDQNNDS